MALVADGSDKGKLCVIIDVINQRTVSNIQSVFSLTLRVSTVLRHNCAASVSRKPRECALFRI